MFTCIECEQHYDHLTGDLDERMCHECLDGEDDNDKVSNCCGALPIGETYDDLGFCSECRDHAVFESEEEHNDSV